MVSVVGTGARSETRAACEETETGRDEIERERTRETKAKDEGVREKKERNGGVNGHSQGANTNEGWSVFTGV